MYWETYIYIYALLNDETHAWASALSDDYKISVDN